MPDAPTPDASPSPPSPARTPREPPSPSSRARTACTPRTPAGTPPGTRPAPPGDASSSRTLVRSFDRALMRVGAEALVRRAGDASTPYPPGEGGRRGGGRPDRFVVGGGGGVPSRVVNQAWDN